ncbi:MAG TPA: TonB C-terminal domain-containing protein [Rhizomicrobium sp.]|jgi:protein TonB|nr:TonB C-terminal domain-containing protein [Rhizomicrobium sp.]
MSDKRSRSRLASRLIAAVGAICLILGFVWFVHVMMGAKSGKPQRLVQTIQVIRPPPPPPPDQPPPPPPEKTEQPLPKDQPEPTPDQSPPPDQPLGLDAQGGPGSDAFGLAGRPGGGDFIGGNGTAPFAWYTSRISDAIKEKLAAAPCTKSAKGSLTVHVTLEADGRVKQIKLATTTGNAKVDECIDSALTSVTSIGDPVPPGMPAQVNLKIVART